MTCERFDMPHAPLDPLDLPWLATAGVQAAVLRLDRVDPLITGNKGFKLRDHLVQAWRAEAPGLVSLGGAHSNHLHALAAAGKRFGFATAGLLRGQYQDTPTVRDLQAFGMHLHWLGHGGYRARHEADFWRPWQVRYPGWHCIPEGGGGRLGMGGCAVLLEQVRLQLPQLGWDDHDVWWLAVGTGTTLAGLVQAEQGRHPVHGALAVPARYGVARDVQALVGEGGYRLHEACGAGFGQVDTALRQFMDDCERASGVPLEGVYTGKALLALQREVQAGGFAPGTRVVFVHTGGLQGRRGYGG